MIRFGSVCSGIEAASAAWHPLGWASAWFAEIEPFPSAVLAHHFPETANHGDMTRLPVKVLTGEGDSSPHVAHAMCVRRITPVESERLQGFPDNWTQIPWRGKPADECPDGHRYKALGNSMAVPVMRWIGERIAAVTAGGAPC